MNTDINIIGFLKRVLSTFKRSKPEAFNGFDVIASDWIKPESVIEGSGEGIVFFPDWSFYNPYQKLLYKTLNKLYGFSSFGMDYVNFTEECLRQYSVKCNILHLHWIKFFFKLSNDKSIESFFLKLELAKNIGYTIIWTVHNLVSHDTDNNDKEIEVCKRLSSVVDYIIVHGSFAKEEVISKYSADFSKIHVIPHGHYRGFYNDIISQRKARKLLNIPAKDLVFLFFGNIKEYKGLNELIDTFVQLNKIHPNSTLLIAGRGLDSKIKEYVELNALNCTKIKAQFDFIPDSEVQIFFNSSDLVVLPYKNILTSGAALLALSFLKPVIAPSIGLLPEVICDNTGFLYVDYAEMRDIMRQCLENPKVTHNFSSKSFRDKLAQLDWSVLLKDSFFSKFV